jgi:hypothetical protein
VNVLHPDSQDPQDRMENISGAMTNVLIERCHNSLLFDKIQ